jgi:hypothetical protein
VEGVSEKEKEKKESEKKVCKWEKGGERVKKVVKVLRR